jgi:aquaporin Z
VFRGLLQNDAVRFAVTVPGIFGDAGAFLAEVTISFFLMSVILFVSNCASLARFTPFFVGSLYAIYITFEAPLSGTSMNPARTLGSAFHADYWHALWIYFVAPILGMMTSAEFFLRTRGRNAIYCAKLHHANDRRCIFHHASAMDRGPGTT